MWPTCKRQEVFPLQKRNLEKDQTVGYQTLKEEERDTKLKSGVLSINIYNEQKKRAPFQNMTEEL